MIGIYRAAASIRTFILVVFTFLEDSVFVQYYTIEKGKQPFCYDGLWRQRGLDQHNRLQDRRVNRENVWKNNDQAGSRRVF